MAGRAVRAQSVSASFVEAIAAAKDSRVVRLAANASEGGTARGGGTRRDVVGDVVVEVDALEHAVRGVRDGRRAEGNLAARPIVGIR